MDAIVSTLLLQWAPYLTSIRVLVPLGWVTVRGQSLFPVRDRLWRWFRRKDAKDPSWLSDDIRERVELLEFRVLFRWADTLAEARRMKAWATANGVDMGALGDCGSYFNGKALTLRRDLPTLKSYGWAVILAFALTCVGLLAGLSRLVANRAILGFQANGGWLVVTEQTARPLDRECWSAMTRTECTGATDPARFGADRMRACDLLNDSRTPAMVRATLRDQRVLGGIFVLYGVILLSSIGRWMATVRSARPVGHELGRCDPPPAATSA